MRSLVLALLAVACRVEAAGEDVDAGDVAAAADVPASADQLDDVCARLPPTGACALACDLQRLIADHVPPGTCMSFVCDLRGGGTLAFHVCAPGD